MMRSKYLGLFLVTGLLLAFLSSGCATPARPDTSPISFTKKHRTVTTNEMGNKKGKACKTSILGFINFGEKGYYKAAKNGDVTKISSVHDTYSQFFTFLFLKHCTVVTGS